MTAQIIFTVNGETQMDALFALEDGEYGVCEAVEFIDYIRDSETEEVFFEKAGGLWL